MDGFELDLPMPVPNQGTGLVADSFDYEVAFKFAFVGAGQCGGRIASTFHSLGYRRICAVNTTIADLGELTALDASQKLDIGNARGAGKDPAVAAALAKDRGEDFFELFKNSFGNDVDYIFVCFSAAGGSGAGLYPKIVEIARRYMEENKRPVKVGAIVSLPKDAEGQKFARNALHSMRNLVQDKLSPVIFIDNQKVVSLYNPKQSEEKPLCNKTTATLLHAFNRLAGTESANTSGVTFDRADFAKLLDGGMAAFGACTLPTGRSTTELTSTLREQLRQNMLASVDMSKATLAGLLYVLDGSAFDDVLAADLDQGTQMLTRIMSENSTVYPGIYRGKADSPAVIRALVMLSTLPWPQARLSDLARVAGMSQDSLASLLGV